MSQEYNLGRVKGDTGTAYIPQITVENGKQYISFISNDGTPVPPSLQKKEFTSRVYVPSLLSNGHLKFSLRDSFDEDIDVGNVKGETGNSTIGTKIVSSKPVYNDLPAEEKALINEGRSLIYVIDNDEAYLDTGVFNGQDFVYFENKLRFDEYYLKTETYNKNELFNRNEIKTQLGTIAEQQNAITRMLGDTSAIIIPDDGD